MGNALAMQNDGFNPGEQLWKACVVGNVDMLLDFKSKVSDDTRHFIEWKDRESGRTPLMVASSNGRHECIALLLAEGAKVNAKDDGKDGNTALHYACTHGHTIVAKTLLDHDGCNPYLWNKRGCSALDAARAQYALTTESKVLQCIQLLENRFTVHKGWLYHCAENAVSKASRLSSLNSWNKRYCLILRTGSSEYLEMALFKSPTGEHRIGNPSFMVWVRVLEKAKEGKKNAKWFNSKPNTFVVHGCRKAENCSAVLGEGGSFNFAATEEYELSVWMKFFNSTAPTIAQDPQFQQSNLQQLEDLHEETQTEDEATQEGKDATLRHNISQEEQELLNALSLSRQMNQGLIQQTNLPPAPRRYSKQKDPPISNTSTTSTTSTSSNVSNQNINPNTLTSSSSIGDDCIICMEKSQSAVAVPCGHNATCVECLEDVKGSTGLCPVCRTPIREVVKLFKA